MYIKRIKIFSGISSKVEENVNLFLSKRGVSYVSHTHSEDKDDLVTIVLVYSSFKSNE